MSEEKGMKRSSVLGMAAMAVGLLCCVGWARAQQASAPAKAPRIAVVDMQRLIGGTALGKQYAEQANKAAAELRTEGEKRQAVLGQMDERLKQQQELLTKDQTGLSPATAEQRQQAAAKLAREREAYRQDSEDVIGALQRKVQREQQRIDGELQEKLSVFLQQMVSELSIDVVLDRRVCPIVNPTFDLTDEVIRRAGAAGSAAAAPTAARPAAKASPKPRP
jgi:Skp family chaperone for outer membrane proteins